MTKTHKSGNSTVRRLAIFAVATAGLGAALLNPVSAFADGPRGILNADGDPIGHVVKAGVVVGADGNGSGPVMPHRVIMANTEGD